MLGFFTLSMRYSIGLGSRMFRNVVYVTYGMNECIIMCVGSMFPDSNVTSE